MFDKIVGHTILYGEVRENRIIERVVVNSRFSFPQSGHYVYDIIFKDGTTEAGLSIPQMTHIKEFILNIKD